MSVLTIFFSFGTLSKTRGHAYKLYKPQDTKTARKNFFAEREKKNMWNSLPPVVGFSSLACFKRTIINVDFREFFEMLMHCIVCVAVAVI